MALSNFVAIREWHCREQVHENWFLPQYAWVDELPFLAKGFLQPMFVSRTLCLESPSVESKCSQSPMIARKSLPIAAQSFHSA